MTNYDEKLGRYTYTGYKAGDLFPFKTDAVRQGRFEVTIAGARYGKGSSREHSPAAEKLAGIKLVIAKSLSASIAKTPTILVCLPQQILV